MTVTPQVLLLISVVVVGVLHTIVPDHWVPITLIARQQKWTKRQTALAAFRAGIGHVLSTLAIAVVVWVSGVAFATHFGNIVDIVSSLALIAFGGWIAVASLREMREGHSHSHGEEEHMHDHDHHGPSNASKKRTALLLILGSSPMIEGIPAFFAASKYGLTLIIPMAILFGLSTIATYVILTVYSFAGLEHVKFSVFEKYGEVLSGSFIALIGIVFLIWPVL